MKIYKNLKELKAAYDSGELRKNEDLLWIDNDYQFVSAGDDEVTVYRHDGAPEDILLEALELLGIPASGV